MKKILFLIIALALLGAGAFFFLSHTAKRSSYDIPIIGQVAKDKSLDLLVEKLLKELEREKELTIIKDGDSIAIETHNKEILNLINNKGLAKENNIIAISSKDLLLFRRGDESFSVKLLITREKEVKRPVLSIIIDDIGNSKELGEELFKIKGLTYSILPNLPYSSYFEELAKKENKDIMLHIPMEPKDISKYGNQDNLIKVTMSDKEIIAKTELFINSLSYVKGVNNHMGSKFTEDAEKIVVFLKEVKKRGLFFLDSRTSPDSKAYDVAKEMGIKSFKRDVFLDHELDEIKIAEQIDKAVEIALKNGFAIAIGHPHRETIKVLNEKLPEISKKVEIVPLSKVENF